MYRLRLAYTYLVMIFNDPRDFIPEERRTPWLPKTGQVRDPGNTVGAVLVFQA